MIGDPLASGVYPGVTIAHLLPTSNIFGIRDDGICALCGATRLNWRTKGVHPAFSVAEFKESLEPDEVPCDEDRLAVLEVMLS